MTRIPEVPHGLPDFKNEQEEARWYAEHPEFFEEMTRKAVEGGTFKLTRKTPAARLAQARRLQAAANKAASTNITIRVANYEIERAKRLAAAKGLRYQTYIKILLHDALEREEAQIETD